MMNLSVSELRYRAIGTSAFADAPPVTATNSIGMFTLADDVLLVGLSEERASVHAARESIEPFLRAWELEAEIYWGFPVIRFEFQRVALVKPLVDQVGQRSEDSRLPSDDSDQEPVIAFGSYPTPPSIRVTPEMEDLWARYAAGRIDLHEPFQSAAYYCLTVVERSAGGRQEAASKYNIDLRVLKRLGELCSTKGDPMTARKALSRDSSPLSSDDRKWMSYTIRSVVLQMGLVAAGTTPSRIALSDLPPIGRESV